jgi:hypothetical protein
MIGAKIVTRKFLVVLAITLAPTQPASAQAAPAPQVVDPKACADGERLQLDDKNSPRDPSNPNLSEKLNRTDGVICPPNVDPQMKAPTPQVGKTPVIPPPGSPGGDSSVRPK